MCEEAICCVYCGGREDLTQDANLEGIWVCRSCRERQDSHQSLIDFGFDDEEPRIE